MAVIPAPGADRSRLLSVLLEVHTALSNVNMHTHADTRLNAYINWANTSADKLRGVLNGSDLERLIRTRGYWSLQAFSGVTPTVAALLAATITEQLAALDNALTWLRTQIDRWSKPDRFVVADTSVYIEHQDKLENWNLALVLHTRAQPLHILVPMMVIDELDDLKRSKDSHQRWRARHSLQVIDGLLVGARTEGQLRARDFTGVDTGRLPEGQVTLEVVLDPPGHTRLSIDDDEIIDRAVAMQVLTGGTLTLITYDTGMATRARFQGLEVVKLKDPPKGDEPPNPHR